ncbi:MAG: NAD(P)/FAD-dependent oxidoreductase [Candidatus Aenigmarchaeota archaeon]|nr:NAD(P)/FAD-dependent oxidoreductase [Candidatus Aenigmarchaeota archaeon]
MVKSEYDVIIVGGGPSGSACAIFLSKYGHKVLLVDKARFPRDKACGDGITGKSEAILKELDLIDDIESNPHGIFKGALFYLKNQKIEIGFDEPYHVVRRLVFDNILFQKAKSLVDTMEGFTVTGLVLENNKVVGIKGMDYETKQEKILKSKIIVGADGATSVIAREMGLAEFKPEHHASALRIYYKNIKDLSPKLELYFFESLMSGYFWIFPLENNMANVGLGMSTSNVQKNNINLQELLFREIKNNPILSERFKDAEIVEGSLRGWNLPLVMNKRKLYGNGFVLLGDAGALIDPFTGEGIGPGLVSAKIASQVINQALEQGDFSEKIFRKYQKGMSKIYIEPYMKYILLSKFVGKFKWLFNRAIKKLENDESFKQLVTMSLSDTEKRKKFTVWTGLKLLFKALF